MVSEAETDTQSTISTVIYSSIKVILLHKFPDRLTHIYFKANVCIDVDINSHAKISLFLPHLFSDTVALLACVERFIFKDSFHFNNAFKYDTCHMIFHLYTSHYNK